MLKDLIALVDSADHAKGFIDRAVHFAEAQDTYLAITGLLQVYLEARVGLHLDVSGARRC